MKECGCNAGETCRIDNKPETGRFVSLIVMFIAGVTLYMFLKEITDLFVYGILGMDSSIAS